MPDDDAGSFFHTRGTGGEGPGERDREGTGTEKEGDQEEKRKLLKGPRQVRIDGSCTE